MATVVLRVTADDDVQELMKAEFQFLLLVSKCSNESLLLPDDVAQLLMHRSEITDTPSCLSGRLLW